MSVLQSFFFAGFEGSTGYNAHGEWIDQIVATQHDVAVEHDYALLREVGLRAAREAVRWPLVDRGGRYDFASLRPFVRAARRHGIDVVWDLFHFGFPKDADLFADALPERFAGSTRSRTPSWIGSPPTATPSPATSPRRRMGRTGSRRSTSRPTSRGPRATRRSSRRTAAGAASS